MGSVGKVVVEDYEDSNYKISRLNFEDHCLQSLIFSLQCSQLSTNERFKTLEELENEEVDYELESLDEVYQFKHHSTQEILYCQSIFHNYNIKISPYFNQMGSIQFYFSFQKELDEILRSEQLLFNLEYYFCFLNRLSPSPLFQHSPYFLQILGLKDEDKFSMDELLDETIPKISKSVKKRVKKNFRNILSNFIQISSSLTIRRSNSKQRTFLNI